MPRKAVNSTKKHILKLKNEPATIIQNDDIFSSAIKVAKDIHNAKNLKFSGFIKKCSDEQIHAMKHYMKHDKGNVACKIERLAEHTDGIKQLIKVRNYLNEAINKSMELTNDAVVMALDEDECDHSTAGVVSLLDVELKIRKDRNEGPSPMEAG